MTSELSFTDVLLAPTKGQFAQLKEAEDRKTLLKAANPSLFARALEEGKRDASSRWNDELSPPTKQALSAWCARHSASIRQQGQAWAALDDYERNGVWHGMMLGASSTETQVGAGIGAAFGPIGAIVGGALGGLWAGSKKDNEIGRITQSFFAEIEHWWNELATDYDDNILALINADFVRSTSGNTAGDTSGADAGTIAPVAMLVMLAVLVLLFCHWVVVAVFFRAGLTSSGLGALLTSTHPLWIYIVGGLCVLLGAFGIDGSGATKASGIFIMGACMHLEIQLVGFGMLGWLGKGQSDHVLAEAALTSASTTTTPSGAASAAPLGGPLLGKWSSSSGLVLEATARADGLFSLRVVELGKLGPAGYRVGETYATLKESSSGVFAVEHKFRPVPPTGLAYDKAAADSCQEVISDVNGKPLTGNLDGERLTVQVARLEAAPTSFKTEGTKIVECRQFHRTTVSVIEIGLDRVVAAPGPSSSRPVSSAASR